jgi:hypothetical protein
MAHVGVVQCVKTKRRNAMEARDLYASPWFVKARRFVEERCDRWFILSAKYGLVEPTAVIEPYEETLNTKSRAERREWARKVWAPLRERLKPDDRVTILAGKKYREDLLPLIEVHGCRADIPMQKLRYVQQVQWLSRQLQDSNRARIWAASGRT